MILKIRTLIRGFPVGHFTRLSVLVGGTMKSNLRACVAFIAGCITSGKRSSSVYDYSRGGYINISGSVDRRGVQIFDHDQGCHFSGSGNGKQYSLHHYGDGCHVDLRLNGSQFTGYAYGTGSHFTGQVNGGSISVYDYKESGYFNYSI